MCKYYQMNFFGPTIEYEQKDRTTQFFFYFKPHMNEYTKREWHQQLESH